MRIKKHMQFMTSAHACHLEDDHHVLEDDHQELGDDHQEMGDDHQLSQLELCAAGHATGFSMLEVYGSLASVCLVQSSLQQIVPCSVFADLFQRDLPEVRCVAEIVAIGAVGFADRVQF